MITEENDKPTWIKRTIRVPKFSLHSKPKGYGCRGAGRPFQRWLWNPKKLEINPWRWEEGRRRGV